MSRREQEGAIPSSRPVQHVWEASEWGRKPTASCYDEGAERRTLELRAGQEVPAHFHEVAISRDARGNYFCSFVYDDRAVVIGDLSQRQMVVKRQIRNRMVYNDWGLYGFVQMLTYKCLRFGKALSLIDERDTTRMCHVCKRKKDMPLWVRTYRCANCGLGHTLPECGVLPWRWDAAGVTGTPRCICMRQSTH